MVVRMAAVPLPVHSLADLFEAAVRANPGAPAAYYFDRTIVPQTLIVYFGAWKRVVPLNPMFKDKEVTP